jgi:hypothetical protein
MVQTAKELVAEKKLPNPNVKPGEVPPPARAEMKQF